MDIVFIRGLRLRTVVGVHPWERNEPRTLILDLELGADCARAAVTDSIDDALDYDAVAKRLTRFASESRFELVESLAEGCAGILREEMGVPWVRLTLSKPGAIGEADDVGVIVERGSKVP